MTPLQTAPSTYGHASGITIRPVAGAIGAEIHGVDLSQPMPDAVFEIVYQAFLDHMVIFFPGHSALQAEHLMGLMERFGEIDDEPFAGPFRLPNVDGNPRVFAFAKEATDAALNLGGFWHTDVTCRERPHKAGLLYCAEAPSAGGDTMFANQYLAYETLSDGMKDLLSSLKAVHSSTMEAGGESARFASVGKGHAPKPEDAQFSNLTYKSRANPSIQEAEHPVVRVHPETGRKHLYVNRGFTVRFSGMTAAESRPMLEYLWSHACRPEFTCRYQWQAHAVAIWDNRCTQHYAVNDYYGERRVMHRVAVHESMAKT